MDADLHADLCDMLRIVMRGSARGVDERCTWPVHCLTSPTARD